ncbi:MAG: CaiB/BaiF CoA-transferase family protein [Mycobacteriales bacterium]
MDRPVAEEIVVVAPLEGIRVVEVANWMAAPGAAAMLADLGADVVKVEPLRGDAVRGLIRPPAVPEGSPALDASFHLDNRGKRGVAVALDKPEGAALVATLASTADVFLNNLLPRRQQKFGLDAESLLARNPRLVHATLTGYGVDGPDMAKPGYDITAFFGRGGITHSITPPGEQAPRARPAQGDHSAALALLAAILAALRLVDRTGEGQVLDVSLFATAAWTMATDLSSTLVDGENPRTTGRRTRLHALQESFLTADERWVLLFMPEARWWPLFAETVGHPEWATDPRFETVASRIEHMSEITDLMDELFATRPLAEWAERFDAAGFVWGPAATVAELASDPHAAAVGIFPEIEHPSAGRFRTVAMPMRIRGADIGPRGVGPEVGQHTEEVLAEAGVRAPEIAALAAAGIVGIPGQGD